MSTLGTRVWRVRWQRWTLSVNLLHHLTGGVDLTQIDGIGAYTALKLVAEIGTDMRRWPSAQHFTSWLTLAPKNKVSGGKLLSSQTQPSANRGATAFRIAAASLGRTQTALGAFYRRLAARTEEATGGHGHGAQIGSLGVPRPEGRLRVSRSRGRGVRRAATRAAAQAAASARDPLRFCPR